MFPFKWLLSFVEFETFFQPSSLIVFILFGMNSLIALSTVVFITTARPHSTKPELSKSCSRLVRDKRWWGSLTMVLDANMAKRLSSVNHTTKAIHHSLEWILWLHKLLVRDCLLMFTALNYLSGKFNYCLKWLLW